MREAASEVRIDIPRDTAWGLLRDLSLASSYVPQVTRVRIDTDQKEGVGASRTVFLTDGSEMQETVEEWNEGQGFLLRLHKGDKPAAPIFSDFFFRYSIAEDGGSTIFRPALHYRPRFGLIGAMLAKLIHKRLVASAHEVGIGMKEFYESGKAVTPQRWKELRASPKAD